MNKLPSKPQEKEWTIRRIVRIIRMRWLIVAMALVAGAGAGTAFQLYYPSKFESTSELLVMRKDSRLASKGIESGGEAEVRVTEEMLATHMQMIQGRRIVESALNEAGLSELPSIVDNLTGREKPCDHVIGNLKVIRGGKGQARAANVLNVSYRSSSDVDSESVLRAIVKKYQSFLTEKFEDVNQEAATLIGHAQKELETDLEEAEKNYERFRQQSAHFMWRTGRSGEGTTNTHRVRYDGILQELAALQLARLDSAARMDAVEDRLQAGDQGELSGLEKLSLIDEKNLNRVGLLLMAQKSETDSPDFQAEQPIRLAHARVEYDGLTGMQLKEKAMLIELGPLHPEVIGVRDQIQSLESFLQKEEHGLRSGRNNLTTDPSALFDAYRRLLKNDLLAMERREQRLLVAAEEAKQLASSMISDEIQGETLWKEVQRKQAIFDAAVDRLRDINLTKDYGGFINEVLSDPERGMKVMPKLKYALPLGAILFFFLAIGGIAVAEYRDRRFRTVDDLRNALRLPVLGRIPLVRRHSKHARSQSNTAFRSTLRPLFLEPDSRAADAFRVLRASSLFSDGTDFRQIICVTSPKPGDGKSTMTGNLAVSLGQLGRSVLIIDCDLRRPTQHEIFDLSNERGLTSLFESDVDATDLIQSTSCKNVSLLARGAAVSNPGELLATGDFARLLESLRDKYDHILLDCAPALAVVDTLGPASIADGSLIVIRVETTSQLQAQAACDCLRHVGADLEGIVINAMTSSSLDEDSYEYENMYQNYDTRRNAGTERPSTRLNGLGNPAPSYRRNGSSSK